MSKININTYKTVAYPCIAEFKDKGSRFIAFVEAIYNNSDAQAFLERIQAEHPKATHHCYAYRFGLDKQHNYRANDDGEPAGSAGRPLLGQIDSKGLSNVMIIVVRYFGGTKLGISGLIHAYKTSAAEVLNQAQIEERALRLLLEIKFDYLQMNQVMQYIKREPDVQVFDQNFGNNCILQFSIAQVLSEQFINRLQGISGIQISIVSEQ